MNETLANVLFLGVRDSIVRTFGVNPASIDLESGPETVPGWDSLGHLRLMMQIEADFHIRFLTEQINQPKNVRDLCALLDSMAVHE